MAYKPKVLAVSEGGTGLATIPANDIIISSATGVISALPNGTPGQILTATTGGNPSWQNASGGGLGYFLWTNAASGNPASSSTYFMGFAGINLTTTSGAGISRMYVTKAGTVKACYGAMSAVALGSAELASIVLRLNNTSDTTVTSSINLSSSPIVFSNTSLAIAVSPGDYLEAKFVTPAWVTPPQGVRAILYLYVD